MTSVDSGVETSNDSNDNSNVQQETEQVPGRWCPGYCTPASSRPVFCTVSFATNCQTPKSCFFSEKCPMSKSELRRYAIKGPMLQDRIDKIRMKLRRRHQNNIYRQKMKAKLNIAVCLNDTLLTETLLQNGNSPNCQDAFGRTPLHYAACKGYTNMVRLLLTNGANPNLHDCIGNTPLHLATVTSNHKIVKLLLEAGTDVQASDLRGKNPINLAMTKLKMLQNCKTEDMIALRKEAFEIAQMLTMQLKKKILTEAKAQKQIEVLTDFCSRLSLSNTSDQVQDGVKDLLDNMNALNITG